MTLGAEIRAARKDRTQTEVAKAAGLVKSYLSDIECGRRFPPPETIKRIATAVGVAPDRWLWCWVVEQMGEDDAQTTARYAARENDHASDIPANR